MTEPRTVNKRALHKLRDLTVDDNTVILKSIQRHVMQRANEPDPDRRTDILHPSDMSKAAWCWRHDYYRIINTPLDPKSSSPSFNMESIFEEGHSIHDKWQTWLHEMGWLYGVFQCRECHHRWWALSPMSCDNCGSQRRPKYREYPLAAEELNVAGHSDGGIIKPGEPLRLLEVKSLSIGTLRFEAPDLFQMYQDNVSLTQIWSKIQRPFPSHGRQGQMYLWLVNRLGIPVNEIVFIYEWKPTQAVKEFVMKYNPKTIQRNLTAIEWVAEALEVERPPKRPHWAEDEDSRNCKSCVYRSTCWHLVGFGTDDRDNEDAAPPRPGVLKAKAATRRRALAVKGV
jgi:CRISPR/Cas system-associated exonuclease Cas4 (RecB family)